MKYPIIILALLLTIFSSMLNAQNRITVNLEEFNSIYVTGRADVELIPSNSNEMSITDRKGQPEQVEYEIKNERLKIKTKPDLKKENQIYIKVPYKILTSIEAGNGAVINSREDLEAQEFSFKAHSGGKIELTIHAKKVIAKVTQVSDIILYGKTISQDVVANTGGNYLAYDLECDNTMVRASSGSQAKVKAAKRMDLSSSSKAFVGYIGNPDVTITKSSTGGEIAIYKTNPGNSDNE